MQQQRARPASQPVASASAGASRSAGDAVGNQERVARLPRAIPAVGSLDYYVERHDDFVDREPDRSAPDYYLGYGDKYVRRFSEDVYPLLSGPGQTWLVNVRVGLQEAIEAERARDPAAFGALEGDSAAFRRFAFDTHPQAYWDAGLGGLPVADLLTIGLTPDTPDLLSFEGIVQVGDIAVRLATAWGADALDLVAGEGAATWLVEKAAVGALVVGDGIDHVFGAGAASALLCAADGIGVGLEALAGGVHAALAGVAGAVARGIDAVAGDGATGAALDGARVGAQQGVEVLEDAGEWAAGVWATMTRDGGTALD